MSTYQWCKRVPLKVWRRERRKRWRCTSRSIFGWNFSRKTHGDHEYHPQTRMISVNCSSSAETGFVTRCTEVCSYREKCQNNNHRNKSNKLQWIYQIPKLSRQHKVFFSTTHPNIRFHTGVLNGYWTEGVFRVDSESPILVIV